MRVPRRGSWNTYEMMRLRELFPRVPTARLARLMGRSVESVRRQASVLFRRDAPVEGGWSEHEIEILRSAVGALVPADVAVILGRSEPDVRDRIERLRHERRSVSWSRAELTFLKKIYGGRTDEDLAAALSRSVDEIAAKARELCLAKDKGVGTGIRMPRWTPDEVARLRAIYPDKTNLEIARALGRSVTSIANKAHQLGLSKSQRALRMMGRKNVAIRHRT